MSYNGQPTIRKRLVGRHLRQLRENKGYSVEAVAEKLGISKSAAYRQESGHTATSVADATAYLDMYGVTDEVLRERILTLARASRARGWWFSYGKTAGSEHVDLADAEDMASEIRAVNLTGIHALLETEEYAEAALNYGRRFLPSQKITLEDAMDLRRRRRAVLDRNPPPSIWAVLGESSVRTVFDDPRVMRNQIQHLVELSKWDNVSIQIIPRVSPANFLVPGFFTVMGFGGTPEATVVHAHRQFSDDPEQVASDLNRFSQIQAHAMSSQETGQYLEGLLAEINNKEKNT